MGRHMEDLKHKTTIFFLFLNLGAVFKNSTPENFIIWNWKQVGTIATPFENTRIHFNSKLKFSLPSPLSLLKLPEARDTLGDFIRRSPRSVKIARCAKWSDCDFRRSPRSAYKIADIWHVRYRRLNSPAFAKCVRSRDFLRSFLRIASEVNPLGWAILSHEFLKLPHRRDRRKRSPSMSASIGGENRLRFSLAIKFAATGV